MPEGEETLDLPAWNRAPDPAWGPQHRAAMASLDSEVKEECLREDLKFYFMSPCEKYRARRQIPWKLALQILKIVMVTTQLVRFGLGNQLVVAFKEDNTVAFKHLFLKGFSGVDEDDYSCSIYTQEDAYESIFFAIKQYRHLKNISLATLGYGKSEDNRTGLRFCKQHYKSGAMFSSNETLNIDSDIETGSCKWISPLPSKELTYRQFTPERYQTVTSFRIRLPSTTRPTVEKSKSILTARPT